jgi:hypothetical protein
MSGRAQEIYESITKNKEANWQGMAMVGMLADFTLHFASGVIIEIGMGESSVYLNMVGAKYDRQAFHCDIQGHGFEEALNVPGYFREDKSKCVIYIGSSDSFFQSVDIPPVAFAFIDGDHRYDQVKKDFFSINNLLQDNGMILMHDTYPPDDDYLPENLCGSSYKFRQELEKDNRFDVFTFPLSAAKGVGLTMCRRRGLNLPFYQQGG